LYFDLNQTNLSHWADADLVLASVKTVQERIVVRNDLLESECIRVRSRVTVGSEDGIIAETNGATHGRVNAVLSHASADHQLFDAGGREFRIESSLEERVAGAFVDDLLTGMRCNFRSKRPS
jgi:hypothetical protein